jgi:hypothetical protein
MLTQPPVTSPRGHHPRALAATLPRGPPGACPTAGGLAAALLSASLSPVTPKSGIRTGLMESRIWSIAKVDCNDFQVGLC